MPKTGASFAFTATPRRGRHSGRGKLRLIADTNVSPECGSATARNPSVTFWSRAHPLSTSSTRTRPSKPTPPWTDSVRRIHSFYPKKGAALPPVSALFLRELGLSVIRIRGRYETISVWTSPEGASDAFREAEHGVCEFFPEISLHTNRAKSKGSKHEEEVIYETSRCVRLLNRLLRRVFRHVALCDWFSGKFRRAEIDCLGSDGLHLCSVGRRWRSAHSC